MSFYFLFVFFCKYFRILIFFLFAMGGDDVTQHSVEERFCNQGQFNSSAALTLPDFALTLHTNPSHVVRRKTQSSGKEKYTHQKKRNTLVGKREIRSADFRCLWQSFCHQSKTDVWDPACFVCQPVTKLKISLSSKQHSSKIMY